MSDVLNKSLYARLRRNFGPVKVTNQREEMVKTLSSDTKDDDSNELTRRVLISHAGEYYRVSCPYCNDTRHRLYVNHMFAQPDGYGRRMTFLATCFNEGCLENRKNYDDFMERMDDITIRDSHVDKGVVVPEEAREVLPPGRCTPLAELERTHPARVYLQSRKFDPDYLSRMFSVSLCHESRYSLARNRIIIPIFDRGKLKGWQARYVGELNWKGPDRKTLPPKYFSCPDSDFRSRCVYNLDRMSRWETGVIVEGPTDAWNFGAMAGCIFGNTMTEYQRNKFLAVFRKRTGVLLLDPEEYESKTTAKLLTFFRNSMPATFCAVKLPDGTDPGSLDRGFLRAYVKEQAGRQGVKVRYKKAG